MAIKAILSITFENHQNLIFAVQVLKVVFVFLKCSKANFFTTKIVLMFISKWKISMPAWRHQMNTCKLALSAEFCASCSYTSLINVLFSNTKFYNCFVYFVMHFIAVRPDMSRTQTTSVKTWSDKPANLSCIAEAIPNATITWKFQGDPIELGDDRFKVFGGESFSSLLVSCSSTIYSFKQDFLPRHIFSGFVIRTTIFKM